MPGAAHIQRGKVRGNCRPRPNAHAGNPCRTDVKQNQTKSSGGKGPALRFRVEPGKCLFLKSRVALTFGTLWGVWLNDGSCTRLRLR